MRILWLAPEWPFPMRTGGQVRVGKMLQELAQTEQIDVAVGVALTEPGATTYEVPEWLVGRGQCAAAAKEWRPRWHRLIHAFSAKPYMPSWYHVDELGEIAHQWAKRQAYDVVVAEHSYLLRAARGVVGCPVVVVMHNVETNRFRSLAATRRGIRWGVAMFEAVKMARFERYYLAHCDAAVTLTREDERWLRQTGFPGLVATIPNGADPEPFAPIPPASEGLDVLFCGSLGYAPNVYAAKFLASLWPSVRLQCPEATLLLVGWAPSSEVADLDSPAAGIRVIPNVLNVAPYYARAGVVAVPIFHGGGAPLKLMEAFAARRPVVTTSLAADAYDDLGSAPFVHRATSPQEFVKQLVDLLIDPRRRHAMGERAGAYARSHTWEASAAQFRQFLAAVSKGR